MTYKAEGLAGGRGAVSSKGKMAQALGDSGDLFAETVTCDPWEADHTPQEIVAEAAGSWI